MNGYLPPRLFPFRMLRDRQKPARKGSEVASLKPAFWQLFVFVIKPFGAMKQSIFLWNMRLLRHRTARKGSEVASPRDASRSPKNGSQRQVGGGLLSPKLNDMKSLASGIPMQRLLSPTLNDMKSLASGIFT
jgi:hypothetical protein